MKDAGVRFSELWMNSGYEPRAGDLFARVVRSRGREDVVKVGIVIGRGKEVSKRPTWHVLWDERVLEGADLTTDTDNAWDVLLAGAP